LPDAGIAVSVVVPTRNRWPLLSSAALPSALGQEDVGIEVIVVDDGSDDETPERLPEYADAGVRVLRNEQSQGVARARNAGIRVARGDWVAFLDDDDLWSPRKLRAQLDAAERDDAAFAFTAMAGLDGRRRFLYVVPPPDPVTLVPALLRWNVIWGGCSNVTARTDLVRELGGFDEALAQLSDWDLWIRLALAGRAAAVPEALVGYVMHTGSMLLTDRRDVFPEFEYLVEKHEGASREWGVEFDQALFTRWVARGQRLADRRSEAARTYLRGVREHGDLGAIPRALGAFAPRSLVEAGRWLAANDRRSSFRKVAVPEPDWIAQFRRREGTARA
jgi:Glycosyl transferase family 2